MLKMYNRENYSTPILFFVFIIIFLLRINEPVLAQTGIAEGQKPLAVKVAFSDDQSIIIERALHTALKRSGCEIVAKITGMQTAVADVNYGDAAILPAQTDGWDVMYPNLIKVPVAIDNVEFTVYSRSNDEYQFSQWSDLNGLRLGYRGQNEYALNNIRRARAGTLVRLNEIEELWDSLLNGYTDAVILPRMSHFEYRPPFGIKKAGIIERQPVYTYVNKMHDYLVPLLENAYQEIISDGTMAMIYSGQKASDDNTVILHINSYNTQNEWEHSQMESIRKSLEMNSLLETQPGLSAKRPGEGSPLEYYSINLNSNESHSQINFNEIISDMIRTEFVMRHLDLIIASGNEAFEFVLNNYHFLFSNVPVLFFGVQKFDDAILYGLEDNITGVFEEISFNETVSQMLKFFPETRRIYILNDNYLSKSICFKETIQENIEAGFRDLRSNPPEFVFNEEKPLHEILSEISGFGSDTLVLIGNYLADSSLTFYSETDIQKLVSQASVNPVFCLTTSYIGQGTIGGLVSSTDEKSNIVASMAVEILKGTPINDVPAIFNSAFLNQWQFDYGTIRKFNINIKNLPKNYILINRELPIWESNPSEFRLILIVALLLLLIICGLIVFFIRNRIMTQNLHHTAMQLKAAAQDASNANKAKSSFLANMSHEIRTPMNVILGIAEIQLQNETISSDTSEAFGKIYESGDLLLNIINDILDLSKIEAGKLEIIPFKYDIPSLVNDSVQFNRLRYDSKPIDLSIHVDENMPHYLFGDELRIRQVLNNILSNAYKYTDEGMVTLYVSAESIQDDSENVMLVLRICDTGHGMTAEQLEELFNEYTRFNAEANRETVGTGLGMSITKQLLDLMKGEITVKSEPGEGTEFIVRLPQKTAGAEICGKEVSEKLRNFNFRSTTLSNKTQFLREYMPYGNVLVVDDVESNIYVIKGMLLPYGINVDIASSGFEAIKKIKDGNIYDIVFMDHMMPKMDGVETTKRLRDMGYKHNIVALTANAIIGCAEMFMKNGFDGYISKPIDSRELNLILNELIRSKKSPEVIEAVRYFSLKPKSGKSSAKKAAAMKNELTAAAVYDVENALAVLEEILPGIKDGNTDLLLYTTTVHGLKSALANIGEKQLSDTAFKLEKASANNEINLITSETREFINALRLFLEKIKTPETDENKELSHVEIIYLLDRLDAVKTACKNYVISDAKKALADLKQKSWPNELDEILNKISLYIIRGEFINVENTADNAIKMFNTKKG